MEVLIIAGACVAAKWVTDPAKVKKSQNVPIAPTKQPNAPLIYGDDRLKTVDAYVRDLAGEKHREKIMQQFPDSYDRPTTVQPSDPMGFQDRLGDFGAPVNFDSPSSSAATAFERNQQASVATNSSIAPYDPQQGLPIAKKPSADIDDSPMFRDFKFNDTPNRQAPADSAGREVSLLTGQPLESFHGNMQPYFKGSAPRSPEDLQSNARLEAMTGVDGGMGIVRPLKQEVENARPNNPQDIRKVDGSHITGQRNRALAEIKPSYDYMSPVRSTRDAPINSHLLRVLPADIDQTRGILNKQTTYQTPVVGGQKGSNRALLPNLRSNRWDMTKEKTLADLFPTKGPLTGNARLLLPNVRNLNSTRATETNGYVGIPTNTHIKTNVDLQHNNIRAGFGERISNRIETFSPGVGIATGCIKLQGANGQLRLRLPEKGFKGQMGAPFIGKGVTMHNVSTPNATLKDMLANASAGPANPSGWKRNYNYLDQIKSLQLPLTSKAMNSVNNYVSRPRWSMGNGARNHEFTPWSTQNELNQFSSFGHGNVHSSIQANPIMGSIQSDTNREMHGDMTGGPRSHMYTAPALPGQLLDEMAPETLVSDYYSNPGANIEAPRMRSDIENYEFKERIDFGGYYHHGKMGNGPDSNREGLVRVKDEMIVNGRYNVGLDHGNLSQPNVHFDLKDDVDQLNRIGMMRTQPTSVSTDRNPISIKTANREALNPRLDPSTRITNDLFPFVQGGNAQHIF